MSTALARTSSTGTELAVGLSNEQVSLIKRTIARGTTDDELAMFLQVAQRTGLDPFAKQIYAIMRWDKEAGRKVMSIQVGIDGMRAIADRTEAYAPGRETVYEYSDTRAVLKATAFVKKLTGGVWHEIAEAAYFSEYAQGTPMWNKLPHVMLAKCAEARALRRAFPMQLAGLYAREEMAQAETIEDAVVDPEPAAPAPSAAPTVAEGAAALAFEIVNDRLNKVRGYDGDANKPRRKEWWADALGYVDVGPRWSPFTPYTKADAGTKAFVLEQLVRLEREAVDDVPDFAAAPPAADRVPGADDES